MYIKVFSGKLMIPLTRLARLAGVTRDMLFDEMYFIENACTENFVDSNRRIDIYDHQDNMWCMDTYVTYDLAVFVISVVKSHADSPSKHWLSKLDAEFTDAENYYTVKHEGMDIISSPVR